MPAPSRPGRRPAPGASVEPATDRSAMAIRYRWPGGACLALACVLALLAASGPTSGAAAGPAGVQPGAAILLDTSQAPLDGEWVVVTATGDVTWRPQSAAAWQPIVIGGVLPAPSEIETGPTGSVTLVVGGDRLVVAPDSRLILTARRQGEDQRLRQERGRLRVDIESRSGRDVEVRTPLLSLGIKGTSFEVAVDPRQTSILVLDGRVTVSPADGGPPVELGPRQGLSQPTDVSQAARRLEFSDLPPNFSRTGPVRWHLAASGVAAEAVLDQASGTSSSAPGATALRAPARAAEAHSGPPESSNGLGAWLGNQRLLVASMLVAAAGLVVLIGPGLVLGQNLRQRWLDRLGGKGKRRRSLIRGW